jgi:hypothetical protein
MLGSGAWFTDTATSDPNVIYSGTLSIKDEDLSTAVLPPITNMAPGEVTDEVEIVIKNDGNIDLAWFGDLVVTGSPTLKQAIYIHTATMEFLSPDGEPWIDDPGAPSPYTADNFIAAGVGAGPYPGTYNALAAQSPFGLVTLSTFDGTSAMGTAPYEFVGALKPNYSYKLTLQFGFATGAGNGYQNLGPLNISFTAKATQIKLAAVDAYFPGNTWDDSIVNTWMPNQILDQDEP